nr:hypothetical protein Iba_chr07fCG11220 [Ipomoea batatas]
MMGIPDLTEKLTSLPSGIDTHCPNNFSLSSSFPPSPPPPPLEVELSELGTSPTTTSDSSHWDTLDSSNSGFLDSSNSFFLDWYTCDASSADPDGENRSRRVTLCSLFGSRDFLEFLLLGNVGPRRLLLRIESPQPNAPPDQRVSDLRTPLPPWPLPNPGTFLLLTRTRTRTDFPTRNIPRVVILRSGQRRCYGGGLGDKNFADHSLRPLFPIRLVGG